MEGLAQLTGLGEVAVWQIVALFLRIGGMMAVLPVFGEQTIPVRIRLALTLAFTLMLWPAAPAFVPDGLMGMAGLIVTESVTGLALGLMLRLLVIALQVAGTIAAQSTSLSQLFGGNMGPDPLPAMGNLLLFAGLALATALGLHVQLAAFILQSYSVAPVGQLLPAEPLGRAALAEIARSFALAFTLAAPFLVASLLYNVILGVINKAMPQLMVAFVGAPAITFGGLFLLYLAAPLMVETWKDAFGLVLLDPFRGPGP